MTHRLVVASPGRGRSVTRVAQSPVGETVDVGDLVLGAPHLVAGRLVDAEARGIAHATVEVRGPGEMSSWDGNGLGVRVFRRTDELGGFRFDDLSPGTYVLKAYSFDGPEVSAPVIVPPAGDVTDVVLRGDPARVLSVRVTDEGGRPVAGAGVDAWGEGASAASVRTGPDGAARVPLPAGARRLRVRADPPGGLALLPGGIEVPEGASEVTVVLRAGASIRVTVLGPDDAPVPYATLAVTYGRGGRHHGVTDVRGRAVLALPRASSYDVAYESKESGLYASANGVSDGADVTLRAAVPAHDRSLRVRLLRPDGTPAPNEPVSVRAPPAGKDDRTARTDAEGFASFEALPARELTVTTWMGKFAPAVELAVVPTGQTVELRQRAWSRLRGRVLDASGRPVVASVELHDPGTGQMLLCTSGTDSSAESGAFEIRVPEGEPGPFRIVATVDDGRRTAQLDDVAAGAADLIVRFDR